MKYVLSLVTSFVLGSGFIYTMNDDSNILTLAIALSVFVIAGMLSVILVETKIIMIKLPVIAAILGGIYLLSGLANHAIAATVAIMLIIAVYCVLVVYANNLLFIFVNNMLARI